MKLDPSHFSVPVNTFFARMLQPFLVALVLFYTTTTHAQMRQVYLDPVEDNEVTSISFYSPSHGYVGFENWIGFTTDSGRTFTKKYISWGNVDYNGHSVTLTFGFDIKGVTAFHQDTLLVYGDFSFEPSILYSVNGGNTFKVVYHRPWDGMTDGLVSEMAFPGNGATGYAVEKDRILKSVDRGKTWNTVRQEIGAKFTYVQTVDASQVYVGSRNISGSKLYYSGNGGGNWTDLTIPSGNLATVFFSSVQRGWISVWDNNNQPRFYSTTDGGNAWNRVDNDITQTRITKLAFINDTAAYALQGFNVMHTSDGGNIWEPLQRSTNFTYLGYSHNDLFMLSPSQFWVGGGHGFLELTTNAGGARLPKAYFTIDTSGLSTTNTVKLVNYSRPGRQYKWFRNGVQISTDYHTTYTHSVGQSSDLILLVVTDATDSDTAAKTQYFTVPPPPPVPTITSASPLSASEGTMITITGTNLNHITSVTFGGTLAFSVAVISPTRIDAVVGAGASGDIEVSGVHGAATLTGFSFFNQLRIRYIAPVSGPIGSMVTIVGNHFSSTPAANIVYFGSMLATVVSASTAQLIVTVPPGAQYAPVSVTVDQETAYSGMPFMPTFTHGTTLSATSFPAKTDFATVHTMYQLGAADLDGDGRQDMIGGMYDQTNRLQVLRNTSTATQLQFAPQLLTITDGNAAWTAFATGDMDGDGKQDIVTNNNSGLGFFRNTSVSGTVSFEPFASFAINTIAEQIIIADFNRDGKPDVLTKPSSVIYVFKNNATAGVVSIATAAIIPVSGTDIGRVNVGDLTGDGKPEIIYMASYSGGFDIAVAKNTSNGENISFAPPIYLDVNDVYSEIAIGDLDGDDRLDIVAASPTRVIVFRNTTTTATSLSFAAPIEFTNPESTFAIELADLNGDGKLDVALATNNMLVGPAGDMQLTVMENLSTPGNIQLAPEVHYIYDTVNHNVVAIALADFNNDGRVDVAVKNAATSNVSVLLNQATSINVWTGAIDNNWENPGNWSAGLVPGMYTDVVISFGIPQINSNAVVRSITLSGGAHLNVSTGYSLTILQ